jgi:hypothetical protein
MLLGSYRTIGRRKSVIGKAASHGLRLGVRLPSASILLKPVSLFVYEAYLFLRMACSCSRFLADDLHACMFFDDRQLFEQYF